MIKTITSYPEFRVYTFGNFAVERIANNPSSNNQAPQYERVAKEEWRSRGPATALLKLLICRTSRRATRDVILDNLWPDADIDKASKSLDVAASILRSVLRTGNEKSLLVMTHSGDTGTFSLPGQQRLWVDADAFDEYLTFATRAEGEGQDSLPYFEAAQHLLQGEFLEEDVYIDWTQARRNRIETSRRRLLHRLTDLYQQRGYVDQAESLLQTHLATNPTDEDILCRLMLVLAQQERRQEALNLYRRTARVLQEEQATKPAARTRELAERIRNESSRIITGTEQGTGKLTLTTTSNSSYTSASRKHAQAVDALMTGPGQQSTEEAAHNWLLVTLNDLTHLVKQGWTTSDILASLQTTLAGLMTISAPERDHMLKLAGGALFGEQFSILTERTPSNDPGQLAIALGNSNVTGWAIFNTSPTRSVQLAGETQLRLLRQLHGYVPFKARPALYSGIYRLIGASLFFQARYAESMHAHNQSYLAALEASDPWNMAESLAWQGGIWKACGQQQQAIEVTEAALRLTSGSEDPHVLASRARLLAHWAESAALLHQPEIVDEKLAASAELLQKIKGNEEFDTSTWQQYQATCALYLGNAETAEAHFQQALYDLRPHWTQRRAYTAQFLAQARLKLGKWQESVDAARIALPLIADVDSMLLSFGFMDYVQELQSMFPENEEIRTFAQEVQQQLKLDIKIEIPRYLEVKL